MKLKHSSLCVGLVASTIALGTAPAHAAFLGLTEVSTPPAIKGTGPKPSAFNVASPFTPTNDLKVTFSVASLPGANQAALGSRGEKKSAFGYTTDGGVSFNSLLKEDKDHDATSSTANDWLGTCGETITVCTTTFTFKKGVTYQLGLKTGNAFGAFGVAEKDSYTFSLKSDELPSPTYGTVSKKGVYFLGMEDGGYKAGGTQFYYDYQDWVIQAKAVPEPTTLAGLAIVGGALVMSRRFKAAKVS